jgi:hypothetical protein
MSDDPAVVVAAIGGVASIAGAWIAFLGQRSSKRAERQVSPNGGSTTADAVHRIEGAVGQLSERVDRIHQEVGVLKERIDTRIKQHEDAK